MDAAILAALAGILGLVLGRLLDNRGEAARWKRDQRIRVYESLADSYYQIREAIRVLGMSEPGSADAEAAELHVYEIAASGWNQHVVASWLHGSPSVVRAVQHLDRSVVELFLLSRTRHFTWNEFQEARNPALEALESYIEAVRKELHLPGLRVTVHYSFQGLPESQEAAEAITEQAGTE